MLRLKELREEIGLNQQELADRIGVAKSSIGMYEQGRRVPSPKILLRMSKTLDANVEYIMGNTPIRMRPSSIKTMHSETLPEGYIEGKLLESALQDEEGKEMLRRLLKEKLVEINFNPLEQATAKSLSKMLASMKDDETKKTKLDIIKTIIELDFTPEQLNTFSNFLKAFKTK